MKYEKKNKTQVRIDLDALLRILKDMDQEIPDGKPQEVYLTLQNVLELTWTHPDAPVPF